MVHTLRKASSATGDFNFDTRFSSQGGIIQHHCTNKKMNHAVQLVGYSLKDGPVPYWQAKNQWGTSFGENGYIRIKYGDNLCGKCRVVFCSTFCIPMTNLQKD